MPADPIYVVSILDLSNHSVTAFACASIDAAHAYIRVDHPDLPESPELFEIALREDGYELAIIEQTGPLTLETLAQNWAR